MRFKGTIRFCNLCSRKMLYYYIVSYCVSVCMRFYHIFASKQRYQINICLLVVNMLDCGADLDDHYSSFSLHFQQSSFFLLISFSASLPSPSPAAPLCCRGRKTQRKGQRMIAQCRAFCPAYKKKLYTMWCRFISVLSTKKKHLLYRHLSEKYLGTSSLYICTLFEHILREHLSEHQLMFSSVIFFVFHLVFVILFYISLTSLQEI